MRAVLGFILALIIAGCSFGAVEQKVLVSWEHDGKAGQVYKVYEKVPATDAGTWTLLASTTEKSVKLAGVAAGVHTYKVAAVYESVEMESDPVSADVPPPPTAPTAKVATVIVKL